jgi:hypothetical protein
MTPIFNRKGKAVGWFCDNVVFNINGSAVAFLRENNVFDYRCRYLGRLDRGFLRDQNGACVAYMRGATGGPIPPVPSMPPLPPTPAVPPIPPFTGIPRIPAIGTFSWSETDWDNWIAGKRKMRRRKRRTARKVGD